MTARERAQCVAADYHNPQLRRLVDLVEQVIIAAEEEAKKAEREACAAIAKEVREARNGFDESGVYCAQLIENRIRARGDS